jgi:hypothetical protein
MMRGLELKPMIRPEITGDEDAAGVVVYAAAATGDGADIADGIVPVGMVEQVEEVDAEFEGSRLMDLKALQQGEIEVVLGRPA